MSFFWNYRDFLVLLLILRPFSSVSANVSRSGIARGAASAGRNRRGGLLYLWNMTTMFSISSERQQQSEVSSSLNHQRMDTKTFLSMGQNLTGTYEGTPALLWLELVLFIA